MTECNLIIVHRGSDFVRDFREIAEKMSTTEPAISVYCIDPRTSRVMPDDA
jgi:hypothetical protein